MSKDRIFLLHGLMQKSNNMMKMRRYLEKSGYEVHALDYASRNGQINDHIHSISEQIKTIIETGNQSLTNHFVGFSLGGVLTRLYLEQTTLPQNLNLGRVVFIGAPMRGTKLVNFTLKYFEHRFFPITSLSYGPTIHELIHDHDALPKKPLTYEAGTITGTSGKSIPFAWAYLNFADGGFNDGRVSEKSSRIEGEADHIRIPAVHFYMPQYQSIIEQTAFFLQHGKFNHDKHYKREYFFLGKALLKR